MSVPFTLFDSDEEGATPALTKSRSLLEAPPKTGRRALATPSLVTTPLPDSVLALTARKRGRAEGLVGGSVPMLDEALLLRERDASMHGAELSSKSAEVERLQKQVRRP